MKRKIISLVLCFIFIAGIFHVRAVDTTVEFAIQPEYDAVNRFTDGLAVVQKSGKWGCIDMAGTEVIPFDYDETFSFDNVNGYAIIKKNGKYGVIDYSGTEVIKPQFEEIRCFKNDDKGAVTTLDGSTPPVYDESILSVEKDSKWGCYDLSGNEIIPPIYDEAICFENGLSTIMKKSEFYQTYAIFYDKNDLAPYKKDGKFGFVRYEQ